MCDSADLTILNGSLFEGYKIVAKNTISNKYYSLAMGFKYENHRKIPITRVQHRLSNNYSKNILDPNAGCGFQSFMKGRTSIFDKLDDAKRELGKFFYTHHDTTLLKRNYKIVIVSAHVYNSVIKGSYGQAPCFIGKRLIINQEIT